MIKVILYGCCGAMGKAVTAMAQTDPEIEITAGIDLNREASCPYPVFSSLEECNREGDVIIDFSGAGAADALLDFCGERKIPLVLCSTGLTTEQLDKVGETAKSCALLRSANMSLGVNLLLKLAAEAAKVLAEAGFDMEIVEKHHNQKKDAPSGTALALADAVNEAAGDDYRYVYDRSQLHEKRTQKEIGISAVRGGTIVGDHDVIYAGPDEVVTLSHRAYSKNVFAKGALTAAKFLAGKEPGLYTMSDVIGS